MKKIITILLLFLSLSVWTFAQDFPAKPQTLVNDYTETLTASQIQQLEQKLVALDDSTSRQMAICILKSVGEYDIGEYATELGRKWGVGKSGQNNGVLILVALGDRKISIQVGYGLEGAIPDMYTNRVINEIIKPNFKQEKYFEGLDEATDALIAMTKGEYAEARVRSSDGGKIGPAFVIFIIIIVLVIVIASKNGGNGGGGVISGRGSSLAEALIWGALNSRGRGGDSWGGGGGSSWGGGSSGGGFGGFGGGSFGGGGSSGSW